MLMRGLADFVEEQLENLERRNHDRNSNLHPTDGLMRLKLPLALALFLWCVGKSLFSLNFSLTFSCRCWVESKATRMDKK